MSVIITERIFTDEFTGAGGGGVTYPNIGILGKMIAQIDFYSYLARIDKRLIFNAAGKTITNGNDLDTSSFLQEPDGNIAFRKGMILTVEGTVSNNGSYTIASVTSRVITVVEALINETDEVCSIFDDTPITALDFYYNLIENTAQESYLSLTDNGAIQRFTIDGLDASDIITIENMLVASSSFGWVTNEITNLTTGETNQVTIKGMGISAHKQSFRIIQQFSVAPFVIREQLTNFENNFAPDYFRDGKALKHIIKLDAKFSFTDPNIPHTGKLININGLTNWFDQNNIRSRPEYYIESIEYEDDVTALPLERVDFNKVTNVLIILKSRNAKFNDTATKTILDFLYIALDTVDYIDTPSTTLRQNLMNDRKLLTEGTGGNGEYYGTDYQVLTQIVPTFINDSTMNIEFKVDFSTLLKNKLKAKSSDNRNYAIAITTQDSTITTTVQTDCVPVLCDVQNMDWNQENLTLIEAVDNIRAYHFPNVDVNARNTISGWEGDPVYVQFPFRVETAVIAGVNPTIMRAGFQIVVRKINKQDFILQENIFDTSLIRKLDGIQTIDIEEELNIIINENDPNQRMYFKMWMTREIEFDSGTKKGFIFSYPFTLLYEFWAKLIQDSNRFQFDIFKDINNPTKAWNTLQQNGWTLAIKFLIDIKGYDDFITSFNQYWDIDCKALGDEPDDPPIFESTTKYELYEPFEENHLLLLNAIETGKKTLITSTYLGDFTIIPDGLDGIYSYIFFDLENQGGINMRRFASTEFDSEEDSPFSAPPYLPEEGNIPDESRASANVRINIFNFDKVIVETIYDDTKNEWSNRANNILIFLRLGFMIDTHRRFEDGELHLWEDGEEAKFET